MTYSACDFSDSIQATADDYDLPPFSRAEWNKWCGDRYASEDWPPEGDDGLRVLAWRIEDAIKERRDALALLREIRDFWAGGDCPPELWARIVEATEPKT